MRATTGTDRHGKLVVFTRLDLSQDPIWGQVTYLTVCLLVQLFQGCRNLIDREKGRECSHLEDLYTISATRSLGVMLLLS